MTDIDRFEQAFSMHVSGPVSDCDCGRVFWDCANSGYDWSEGEVERLEADKTATPVPHGVERIYLEGRIYCMDCDCWHERATRIIEWIRNHQSAIGEWFRLEKKALEQAASQVPAV